MNRGFTKKLQADLYRMERNLNNGFQWNGEYSALIYKALDELKNRDLFAKTLDSETRVTWKYFEESEKEVDSSSK